MGKKTKKKYDVITTVNTVVVKLSYIQTLAATNNLLDTSELESEAEEGEYETVNSDTKDNRLRDLLLFGSVFGKKKSKSVKVKHDTTGVDIKDQWLQPYFDRIRYSIGIRELTAASYTFAEQSELVSKPYISPKEIIKVHLVVDEYIPDQFDRNQVWIKYYVKPEGEEKWVRVNPINAPTRFNEEGDIVPKIINFNIPKPTTTAVEDKYFFTDDPIKQMRFRAVLSRPIGGNNDSISPILKSYRMVMVPRA